MNFVSKLLMPVRKLSILVCFFFCGCATLPKSFEALPSYAITQDSSTTLGRFFKPREDKLSGFLLVNTSSQAFSARMALAETAEKTIDAQYFIWSGDRVGIILISRLLHAADRGVRVRLLLDDLTSHGADLGLAAIDRHPNVEIRLFNPLGRRYYWRIIRTITMAFHAGRMTHRMHNKMYIVDNQAAIVGGRNIADEYFGIDPRSNFRDMDLFSVGPVVDDISKDFDAYWNSPWSVPLEVFKISMPSEKKWKKKRAQIEKKFAKMTKEFPYPLDIEKDAVVTRLKELEDKIVWAKSEIVCDPPDKAWAKAGRASQVSLVVKRLEEIGEETKKEMLVVSPYLILTPQAIGEFGKVVKRNVSVKILTNSMKSTDALPVVAFYRGTRKSILENGIELYETRADAKSRALHIDSSVPKSRMSLHGKISVFDRRDVFVGTFNIDPRSQYLNTEVGLLVHSPELATQVADAIEVDLAATNSWKLSLTEKKSVVWRGEREGKTLELKSEPDAGLFKRFAAWVLSLLPIKKQL